MSSAKYPIRRSQLIAPFGVGAMTVVKGGASLVCAGLDFWYRRENENEKGIDEDEFKIEEYRLEKMLKVSHFRLPPDYRQPRKNLHAPNTDLGVPFLRFPQWHVCPRCNLMKFIPLNKEGVPYCEPCKNAEKKYSITTQMPFVAMCEDGHLQDVPWSEFVHRSLEPECYGKLKYISSGGAMLGAQKIVCEICKKERSLGGLTNVYPPDETFLSKNLTKNEGDYSCQGKRPWLGDAESENCANHLRVNLRGATNVWFAQVQTAIYIPQSSENCPPELLEFLRRPDITEQIDFFAENSLPLISSLRKFHKLSITEYTDKQIEEALQIISESDVTISIEATINEDEDTAFRRVEYAVLREEQTENLLVTKSIPLNLYDAALAKLFSRVMLVNKLRETRAFGGFTRIKSENQQKLNERKKLLRREILSDAEDWLPATIVFGEGLFFELNEQNLRRWENEFAEQLSNYLRPLTEAHWKLCEERGWKMQNISPRLLFCTHWRIYLSTV